MNNNSSIVSDEQTINNVGVAAERTEDLGNVSNVDLAMADALPLSDAAHLHIEVEEAKRDNVDVAAELEL